MGAESVESIESHAHLGASQVIVKGATSFPCAVASSASAFLTIARELAWRLRYVMASSRLGRRCGVPRGHSGNTAGQPRHVHRRGAPGP